MGFNRAKNLRSEIETEQGTDGRWIAEVIKLAGVMAYGGTREEAIANVEALAFRVMAEPDRERKTGLASRPTLPLN